ncbi:putative NADH dehydrogenase, FAD-containing subunit [metagenome]|uniref:Putative NADH dehydrogenase, FAD-containing subunit n=1 Tax=metagenome TaxID=256318 RepID=A0A2P2C2E3_9ZZZZ
MPGEETRVSRQARNGTLILGGGFGGAQVARLLGTAGATIVDPVGALLFTPLLPEVAAGALEPRRALVPLRTMCAHAEWVRGRAAGLDEARRVVTVETELGAIEIGYRRLVVALGSTARLLPIPGLAERAITLTSLGDAVHLRNHVLRRLEAAEADPTNATRQLTFLFVGAGYAGVEALSETRQLVEDALRHFPSLRDARPRWVLVEAGSAILAEVPDRLASYTARHLRHLGVDVLTSSRVRSVDAGAVTLADGRRVETETVVWTAGTTPRPAVRALGLPLDERGRIVVDSALRVEGRCDIWALGDNARVPNSATPLRPDPPTCQHAVRQARAVVRSMAGDATPYRYRSIGEGATLGRGRGIARVFGVHVRGRLGGLITRAYHVRVVPSRSRRWRIGADGLLSVVLRRDIVELDVGGSVSDRARSPSTAPSTEPAKAPTGTAQATTAGVDQVADGMLAPTISTAIAGGHASVLASTHLPGRGTERRRTNAWAPPSQGPIASPSPAPARTIHHQAGDAEDVAAVEDRLGSEPAAQPRPATSTVTST